MNDTPTAQGRQQLADWERAQPDNFYTTDNHLKSILEFYGGAEKLRAHETRLTQFGHAAATVVDAAVRSANEPQNLPRLERFNAVGERIEQVIHPADHHLAGKYIYGSRSDTLFRYEISTFRVDEWKMPDATGLLT